MNSAHFHLVVNHLPIIFPIAGLIVLAIGIGFKAEMVKRTSYFLFTIGAVSAAVAMNSGEGAEEIVEELNGVSHKLIHNHEENAESMAVLSYLLGLTSLLALWASWKGKSFSKLLSYLVAVFSLITIFLGQQTGTSGGEIRHTEIRTGVATDQSSDMEEEHEEGEDEDQLKR
jgi:uncharacterized membrane protein